MAVSMGLPKKLRDQLARLLQEEEMDLFILTMHYRNDGDLNYFPEADRGQVKSIFDTLIQDTRRHAQLLNRIIELIER
jgi:hypothetical protein